MNHKIGEALAPYYKELKALIEAKKFKEAEKYLNDLHPSFYDLIVESAIAGSSFAGLLGAIDKTKKRVRPEDFYYKGLQPDTNSIF